MLLDILTMPTAYLLDAFFFFFSTFDEAIHESASKRMSDHYNVERRTLFSMSIINEKVG